MDVVDETGRAGPEVGPEPMPADGGRLAQLYAIHAADARRFAYAICGDRALAEDAVQEAFVRVAGRLGALRSPDAFGAYLRRTVVNVLRAGARARQRDERRVERQADLRPGPGPDEADVDSALARGDDVVWAALQALPERQRVAVVCRYWLDLPERDTARILGCRPGTVKSRLSRALESLRADLGDRPEEGSDG
jgi:RNA polymerase sigma-70 factor (sigma-E family)